MLESGLAAGFIERDTKKSSTILEYIFLSEIFPNAIFCLHHGTTIFFIKQFFRGDTLVCEICGPNRAVSGAQY